jgi:hypothetical protein
MYFKILVACLVLLLLSCSQQSKVKSHKEEKIIDNASITYVFHGKNNFSLLLNVLESESKKTLKSWDIVINDTLKKSFEKIHNDSLWNGISKELLKFKYDKPKNAKLTFKNDQFVFNPSVDGNEFNWEKLKTVFLESLKQNINDIDLTKQNCYILPKFHGDELICENIIKLAKEKAKLKLTFENDDDNYELTGKDLSSYFTTNDNMELIINPSMAYGLAAKIANKYDMIQSPVSFIPASGQMSSVSKSLLGKRVNTSKIVSLISAFVKQDSDTKVDVPFFMNGIPTELLTNRRNYIEININEQKIYCFKNDSIVMSSDIVTGRHQTSFATPTGAFYIRYKETNTTLDGPGYSCFVRYFMPIFQGIGLHDASWRKKFGGNIYQSDGSHGCINLPRPVAEFTYNNYPSGTIVICH